MSNSRAKHTMLCSPDCETNATGKESLGLPTLSKVSGENDLADLFQPGFFP